MVQFRLTLVQIQTHSDAVGGDEDFAGMIGVVEFGSLCNFCAWRKATINHRRLDTIFLEGSSDFVNVVFVETDYAISGLDIAQRT